MPQLSDPHRSRVVLVGVGSYTQLHPLPTVANNLTGISEILADDRFWGLPPARYQLVADPTTPQEVGRAVRAAAAGTGVGGLLLVYFAGHGVVDDRTGELHLAVGHTDRAAVYATAVPYEWIRRAVLDSPASRRIVILDCCYAGRAISGMRDDLSAVADEVEIDRTCVLVATSPNRAALAPPDEKYTAFTGTLVTVLRRGVPGGPDPLDVATVYDAVLHAHRRQARPLPELRARNGGERVPLVRNRARTAHRAPPAPPPDPPGQLSYTGCVVVAGTSVTDDELRGATVAVLAHSTGAGALGVRLDRRTPRAARDVVTNPLPPPLDTAPVFDGGPVRDVVILLAAARPDAARLAGFQPVTGGLGTVTVPLDRATGSALAAACLFVGYLGWRPGQLEAELAAGDLVVSGERLDAWFWLQHGR
ncbi:caspase family protein [Planosporangium thailandense]|uniref:Caspase family protein n=1 Tax=Planosporangium thailandense TaxID=765197 RepID=A0ABX0XY99_9ACTN|nr:YqgE/AlgH family protein [Planosporangium thailandense]NJC70360.1 caspase family protein [Planosporangium thailandense]